MTIQNFEVQGGIKTVVNGTVANYPAGQEGDVAGVMVIDTTTNVIYISLANYDASINPPPAIWRKLNPADVIINDNGGYLTITNDSTLEVSTDIVLSFIKNNGYSGLSIGSNDSKSYLSSLDGNSLKVETYNTATQVTNTWTYSIDGTEVLPGGSVISEDATSLILSPVGSNYQWAFRNDGNLQLPIVASGDTAIGTAFNTNPPGHTLTLRHNGGVNGGSGGELKFDYGMAEIKVVKDAGITQTWTFDTDGTLTLPGGSSLVPSSTNVDLTAGVNGWAELSSNNAANAVWVDNSGAYVGTNWTGTAHSWTFGMNGVLSLPGIEDDSTAVLDFFPAAANNHIFTLATDWTLKLKARADGANEGHLWLEAGQNTKIKVNGNGSTVDVVTSDGETSNTWTFDNTGVLTIPSTVKSKTGNYYLAQSDTSTEMSWQAAEITTSSNVFAGMGSELGSGDSDGVWIATAKTDELGDWQSKYWKFGFDGKLTLPGASTIEDIPDGIDTGGVLITVGSNPFKFETSGATHLPNDLFIDYGSLKVRASNDYDAIKFSDDWINDSGSIGVDLDYNMYIKSTNNLYIKRDGVDRVSITPTDTILSGNVTFSGPVTFNGTATYVLTTNTVYTDNILELHTPPDGINSEWTVDDGMDIGLRFHYYNGQNLNGGLVLANDTKYLEWYEYGVEANGNITGGVYGTFKTGKIELISFTSATSTLTGALKVAGGVGVGGSLYASALYDSNSRVITQATLGTYGVSTITAGTGTAVSTATGEVTVWSTAGLQTVTDRGTTTTNAIYINNATASVSTLTGALRVAGGIGVQGSVYAGALNVAAGSTFGGGLILNAGTANQIQYLNASKILVGSNNLTFDGTVLNGSFSGSLNGTIGGTTPNSGIFTTLSATGITVISNAVAATNTSSGALRVTGGVGVGGSLYAGNIYDNGNRVITTATIPVVIASTGISITSVVSTSTIFTISNTGVLQLTGGTDISVSTSTGNITIDDTSTLQTVTGRGATTNQAISITNATLSTSTSTGALKVTGGVGVGGSLYATALYDNNSRVITAATLATAGIVSVAAGTGTAVSTTAGIVTVWSTATLQTVTSFGATTPSAITITNATASTSTTSGALKVTGGIGADNAYLRRLNVNSTATFSGAISVSNGDGAFGQLLTSKGVNTQTSWSPNLKWDGTRLMLNPVNEEWQSYWADTYSVIQFGAGTLYGDYQYENWSVGLSANGTFDPDQGTWFAYNDGYITLIHQDPSLGQFSWLRSGYLLSGSYLGDWDYMMTLGDSGLTLNYPLTVASNQITTLSGATYINDTTTATSTITGALVVAGGVGVGGKLYADAVYDNNIRVVTAATAGTDTSVSVTNGNISIWNTSTLQTVTSRGATTNQAITITNATASTGTTNGALTVTGGIGAGNAYVGSLNVTGVSTLTGNVTVSAGAANQVQYLNASKTLVGSSNLTFDGTTLTGAFSGPINGSIGGITPSTGAFTTISATTISATTISASGVTTISNTSASNSTSTGALTVAGGVGIGGSLYAGNIYDNGNRVVTSVTPSNGSGITITSLVSTGTATSFLVSNSGVITLTAGTDTAVSNNIGGTVRVWNTSTLQTISDRGSTTTNVITVNNSTSATSTASGALIVAGGVGVGGRLYAGNIYDNGNRVVTSVIPTASTGINITSVVSIGTATSFTISNTGVLQLTGGTDISVTTSTGNITVNNTSTLQSVTGRGATTSNGINITNTASATTVGSGALVVAGGVGVGGKLYASNVHSANTATFAGPISVDNSVGSQGNLLTSLANSGSPVWSTNLVWDGLFINVKTQNNYWAGGAANYGGIGFGNSFLYANTYNFQGGLGLASNGSYDGTDWKYLNPGYVTLYNTDPESGYHNWYMSEYGTTGQYITDNYQDDFGSGWRRGMVLDNLGNLVVTGTVTSTGGFIDNTATPENSLLYKQSGYITGSSVFNISNDNFIRLGSLPNYWSDFYSGWGSYTGIINGLQTFYSGLDGTNNNTGIWVNAGWNDEAGDGYRQVDGYVAAYAITNGNHNWQTGGYGLAGSSMSDMTSKMYLTNDGLLGIGTSTNLTARLTVNGTVEVSSTATLSDVIANNLTVNGNFDLGGITYTSVVNSVNPNAGTGIDISEVVSTGPITSFTISNTGVLELTGGTDISVTTSTGNITVNNTSTLQSVTDRGSVTSNAISITNTSFASSTITGALIVAGGVGVGGDLYATGGYFGDTGLDVTGPTTFRAPVLFLGTSTFVATTNTVYTDNILNLHTPVGGVDSSWDVDDGLDIGFRFHYYTNSTDTNAALVLANDTKYLEWYQSGVESSGNITSGVYGTFKAGSIRLVNTTTADSTTTGALVVAGGIGAHHARIHSAVIGENGGSLSVVSSGENNYTLQYATQLSITQPDSIPFALTIRNANAGLDYGLGVFVDDNGHITFESGDGLGSSNAWLDFYPITGITTLPYSTEATNTTTGALVVTGGVGIGGSLYASNVYDNGNRVITTAIAGTDTVITTSSGSITVYNNSTLQTITNRGSSSSNAISITNTTGAADTSSGALVVTGGVGVGGNLYATALYDNNSRTITAGTIASHAVTTLTAGTDTVVTSSNGAVTVYNNSTLQTITNRGAATSNVVSITNATTATSTTTGALIVTGGIGAYNAQLKQLHVEGPTTFGGDVTFSGTATYVLSTNTIYTDNIVELHTHPGGVTTQWTSDDGKDIGFRFHHYANSTDTNAALVLANDTKYLEWYRSGAESTASGVITGGTYGTFKTGSIKLVDTTTSTNVTTGALTVAGGVGVGGNIYAGGKLNVYGGATIGTANNTATAVSIYGSGSGQVVFGYDNLVDILSEGDAPYQLTVRNALSPNYGLAIFVRSGGDIQIDTGNGVNDTAYWITLSTVTNKTYFYNSGGISITSNVASAGTDTGALVVAGGVGVGGSLNANNISGTIVPRFSTVTTPATSTFSWNSNNTEVIEITALDKAITLAADSGTPYNGQKITLRIKDNGTARNLTWTTSGSKSFRAIGVTLPSSTVVSKLMYIGCMYNSSGATAYWDVIAVSIEA